MYGQNCKSKSESCLKQKKAVLFTPLYDRRFSIEAVSPDTLAIETLSVAGARSQFLADGLVNSPQCSRPFVWQGVIGFCLKLVIRTLDRMRDRSIERRHIRRLVLRASPVSADVHTRSPREREIRRETSELTTVRAYFLSNRCAY